MAVTKRGPAGGVDDIGDLLVRRGLLSQQRLDELRYRSQVSGTPLWKLLLEDGALPEAEVLRAVAEVLGLNFVEIRPAEADPAAARLFNVADARKLGFLPISQTDNSVLVAVDNPYDIALMDEIRQAVTDNRFVEFAVATRKSILAAIDEVYRSAATPVQNLLDITGSVEVGDAVGYRFMAGVAGGAAADATTPLGEADFPIIKLVNGIISQAVQDKASDIHIEPEEDLVRIRFRIDGILHEMFTMPKRFHAPLASRVKILARLDIAEARVSMDGRFQMKIGAKLVDVRVSTMPVMYGENVVMRLLDTATLLDLAALGLHATDMEKMTRLVEAPYGMILFAGPTGSGKTTALYCCLNRLNSKQRNIYTIEDPVEYRLPLVRQIQVNVKTGMTFAHGMRSVLRQDPDVLMVGEIRDRETAEIAVQAALTGHLVLSSIHTNDAAGTVVRFLEMQIEPYLISAGVAAVCAQRLVRVLCTTCREKYVATPAMIQEYGLKPATPGAAVEIYRAKGCTDCRGVGYKGRTGIFEVLVMDDQLRDLVSARASSIALCREARRKGMVTLRDDGMRKVLAGITTVEEVARVTRLLG